MALDVNNEWRREVLAWASSLERRKALHDLARQEVAEKPSLIGQYIYNVLIAVDQLGNALIGGDPDETISSTLGKAKTLGELTIAGKALDALLELIDKNHSIDAIEFDEGKDAVSEKS